MQADHFAAAALARRFNEQRVIAGCQLAHSHFSILFWYWHDQLASNNNKSRMTTLSQNNYDMI